MIKTLKHIVRGCGYLEHCGHHPGTNYMIIFALMGALAGGHNGGWKGSIFGASFMTIFLAPVYLNGSYERSILDETLSNKN